MPYTSQAPRLFIHSRPQKFLARFRPEAATGCNSTPSAANSAAFASARSRKSARFHCPDSSFIEKYLTSIPPNSQNMHSGISLVTGIRIH